MRSRGAALLALCFTGCFVDAGDIDVTAPGLVSATVADGADLALAVEEALQLDFVFDEGVASAAVLLVPVEEEGEVALGAVISDEDARRVEVRAVPAEAAHGAHRVLVEASDDAGNLARAETGLIVELDLRPPQLVDVGLGYQIDGIASARLNAATTGSTLNVEVRVNEGPLADAELRFTVQPPLDALSLTLAPEDLADERARFSSVFGSVPAAVDASVAGEITLEDAAGNVTVVPLGANLEIRGAPNVLDLSELIYVRRPSLDDDDFLRTFNLDGGERNSLSYLTDAAGLDPAALGLDNLPRLPELAFFGQPGRGLIKLLIALDPEGADRLRELNLAVGARPVVFLPELGAETVFVAGVDDAGGQSPFAPVPVAQLVVEDDAFGELSFGARAVRPSAFPPGPEVVPLDEGGVRTGLHVTFAPTTGRLPTTGFCTRLVEDTVRGVVVAVDFNQEVFELNGDYWQPADSAAGPPSTAACSPLAFDPRSGFTLTVDAATMDVWAWDGETWRRVGPAAGCLESPPPRQRFATAWDAGRDQLMLFGGTDDAGPLNDTWSFDRFCWTRPPLSPAAPAPSARFDAGMAFDEVSGRVVLAGGTGADADDLWFLDNQGWTRAIVGLGFDRDPGAPGADEVSLTFDRSRGRVLLLGSSTGDVCAAEGHPLVGVNAVQRVRALEGGGLVDLPVDPRLCARQLPGFAAHGATGRVYVHSGFADIDLEEQLVLHPSGVWSRVQPGQSERPPGRVSAAMAYSRAQQRTLLFGGVPASLELGDAVVRDDRTWAFDGQSWRVAPGVDALPARSFAPMIFHEAAGRFVLFGGLVDAGAGQSATLAIGDDRALSTDGASPWAQLDNAVQVAGPTARIGVAFAYDPVAEVGVLFGGGLGQLLSDETWLLSFNGAEFAWTEVLVGPRPPARLVASMSFDPQVGGVVLHGGVGGPSGTVTFDDTWAFRGGQWEQLSPAGDPGPRAFAPMVFDEGSGRTLLFPGAASTDYQALEWDPNLDAGAWVEIDPPLTSTLQGPSVVYESHEGRLTAFGGIVNEIPSDVLLHIRAAQPTDRPTATLVGPLGAVLDPAAVERIDLRATCSAVLNGAAVDVQPWAWELSASDHGPAGAGAWVRLGASGPSGALLERSLDANDARRFLLLDGGLIFAQCRAADETTPGESSVTVQDPLLRVTYRAAP